eukprot:jgi/Ulvmu1/7125/UM034_0031.1
MELPDAVADVLCKAECQDLFTKDGAKLRCTLNDHCIPLDNIGVIERFVGGKKFKKLASQHRDSKMLQKFEPFLIPSQRIPGHLFCALTGQLIKASIDAARKHMKGQCFVKGKERFMEDDMELLEEPVDDTAKPTRRAHHRLNRASSSSAELAGPGDKAAAAESSDEGEGSSGTDAHAQMDELLASDDSMDAGPGKVADIAEVEVEEVGDAGAEIQRRRSGKRKQGQPADGDGGTGGTGTAPWKRKKPELAPQLAGLHVNGSAKQKGKSGKVLRDGAVQKQQGKAGNGQVQKRNADASSGVTRGKDGTGQIDNGAANKKKVSGGNKRGAGWDVGTNAQVKRGSGHVK